MKLTLLLVLGLTLLVTGLALTEEDNDFADFEYDIEGDQGDDVPQKVEQKVPPKNQPEQFMEVDLDDGLVEDEFDQDEFEGFGGSDSDGPQEPLDKKKEPKLTMAKVPIHFRNWDSFYIEILFLAGLVVYFVNYALGKNKNIKIANSWLQAHKTFLEDNFALVGDDGKKETEVSQTGVMVKESDSIFTLWCSGRVCCEGMLVELKLIKRQDLLALTMGILSSKVQDQVVIKTEMSKDSMDSFVFAVASKKSASKLFKDMPDLKQYCVSVTKPNEKYGLPVGFSVLSELAESSSAMLDARVIAMLDKYSDVIEYIHISDQFTGPQQEAEQQTKPETKRMLIVSFTLKGATDSDMEELKPLVQLVIYLIDKLKRFKLSREGRAKTEKNRQAVEQEYLKSLHAVRQEAAAQKNSEKRKQEKEKLMAEENVEKQIKLEKKMKRKDAKKAQPKMKSMSIHL